MFCARVAGRRKPGESAHALEHLLTALRIVYHRYDRLDGNVRIRTEPGVSIDPRRETVRAMLDAVKGGFGPADVKRFRSACREDQTVSVHGMPFDLSWSRIAVIADYAMKKIVDGGTSVADLGSLLDRRIAAALESQGIGMRFAMNRFWLVLGSSRFLRAEDALLVTHAPVALETERQHVSSLGDVRDAGVEDPLAEAFARDFSRNFPQLTHLELETPMGRLRIFRALEQLYELIVVATWMEHTDAFSVAALDPNALLDQTPLPSADVPPTLPGRYQLATRQHQQRVAEGVIVWTLSAPSCGGASFAFDPSDDRHHVGTSSIVQAFADRVRRSRPDPERLTWVIAGTRLAAR